MKTAPPRVVIVESALQCAEALQRRHYDVVVFPNADIAFPAATRLGAQAFVVHLDDAHDTQSRLLLVAHLRAGVTTAHIPVIIVTGETPDPVMTATANAVGVRIVTIERNCQPLDDAIELVLALHRR